MASGYGLSGGPSRCFPFWQEFLACHVVNADQDGRRPAESPCSAQLQDYLECLHHTKEAQKIGALQDAYRKREAATPRDQAPNAGEIRSLGLLTRKDADVDVKHGSVIPTLEDNRPRGKSEKPMAN